VETPSASASRRRIRVKWSTILLLYGLPGRDAMDLTSGRSIFVFENFFEATTVDRWKRAKIDRVNRQHRTRPVQLAEYRLPCRYTPSGDGIRKTNPTRM